ncbi:hypothetical protein, partial [Streptococcus pseudopneumoniae]|uniref:hypothetical protein n=1 Tax=Streptococcus pseudopneumoniae TaxID=257758 RepID=UPI001486BCAC
FDDSAGGGDSLNWSITNVTGNEVDLTVPATNAYAGPMTEEAQANGFEFDDFDLINDDADDDYDS